MMDGGHFFMLTTHFATYASLAALLTQYSATRRCSTFRRKYNNMCGVRFIASYNGESSNLHGIVPLFILASSTLYHFSKPCAAAFLVLSARAERRFAMNTCPEMWSLRRLKSSLNKMQGSSEARLHTHTEVAITLMGCRLFCATQRNLHQVNVQV